MNFRQGIFLILKRVELLLKRRSLPLALTVALCCVLISGVEGAVLHALSPSQGDVSNAIDLARDGDTVLVPAGVGYWTSTLGIVNKAITLQGAGTNQTVLVDEVANRQ